MPVPQTITIKAKYGADLRNVWPVARAAVADGSKSFETVSIDNDKIIDKGGETYYLLSKAEFEKQPYVPNTTLALRAKLIENYIPVQVNKSQSLTDTNVTYGIIFYYNPPTPRLYTVKFVEAGTEGTDKENVVATNQVSADQTVVTHDVDTSRDLVEKGYELVKKNEDGTYETVTDYLKLTWIDENGQIQNANTLTGEDIPDTVTYLVRPIVYNVTYKCAESSPDGAADALSAVTAQVNTPVADAAEGMNPTQYTVQDAFTVTNPAPVYQSGKWYRFSHWSLGDNDDIPKTGDEINLTLWLILLGISSIGIITTLVASRRWYKGKRYKR